MTMTTVNDMTMTWQDHDHGVTSSVQCEKKIKNYFQYSEYNEQIFLLVKRS